MPRPKKPSYSGLPFINVELPKDTKDEIIQKLQIIDKQKAGECIRRIEACLTDYKAVVHIENAGTPGGAIETLKPLKKSAQAFLERIQKLDKYSELSLYANSCDMKGGYCDYDSEHMKLLKQELEHIITGIDKAVKRLTVFKKQGRPKDAAEYILKNLLRIFKEYNPEIKRPIQENLFAIILEAVDISYPDIDGNPTRFRRSYGIRS